MEDGDGKREGERVRVGWTSNRGRDADLTSGKWGLIFLARYRRGAEPHGGDSKFPHNPGYLLAPEVGAISRPSPWPLR